jgi:hypothetical protein
MWAGGLIAYFGIDVDGDEGGRKLCYYRIRIFQLFVVFDSPLRAAFYPGALSVVVQY